MRYAIVFGVMSVGWAYLACTTRGWGWLLLWFAIAFAIVSIAYAGAGARVFGKRPDGSRDLVASIVLFPYLATAIVTWQIGRWLKSRPCWHEIEPGLFLGRRAYAAELPGNVSTIVDVTSELVETADVREGRPYVCLPTLDASMPDADAFEDLISRLANSNDTTYVHCAQGNGRSAMFVAAILIARGRAQTAGDAIDIVRAIRPSVRLYPNQIAFLERFASTRAKILIKQ